MRLLFSQKPFTGKVDIQQFAHVHEKEADSYFWEGMMEIRSGEQLLELMRGYQASCVLAAAVDIDVFGPLAQASQTASELADIARADLRGMTILLDALTALGLLEKVADRYALPAHLAPALRPDSPDSVIPMLRHQSVCLRRWARLPWTIQRGVPEPLEPSLRGQQADQEAFIQAMHVVSREVAPRLIQEINPGGFRCVLDLGGASGSWTLAWLDAEPRSRAVIFDLPHVIPMARQRLAALGAAQRVDFVAGDFYTDALPRGADLVWVSAIIHQNSPQENRELYRRIAEAIEPGGWIYIRDIVLDASRNRPVAGALFAVNMLAATPGGNSYTLDEIERDLLDAGFTDVEQVRRDEGMHSIVRARFGNKESASSF